MLRRLRLTPFLAVSILASVSAAGQTDPNKNDKPIPAFGTEVSIVAVPVFVTDKSGKTVAGLAAEDFAVYDGGKRVSIVAFQAVDVDAPPASAALSTSALPVAVQASAARQFLLLFDVVTVVPPSAAPGDYILRLTFRESTSGWTATSETEIALQN